jgi:hypothetical protein
MKSKFIGAVMLSITAVAYSQKDTTALLSSGNQEMESEVLSVPKRANPDTLTLNELNIYKRQAVQLRNTGRVLTLGGIGVTVGGIIAGAVIMAKPEPQSNNDAMEHFAKGVGVIVLTGLIGVPCTLIGIPTWAVGANRKARAEIALKKFYNPQGTSMVSGVGIRIVF